MSIVVTTYFKVGNKGAIGKIFCERVDRVRTAHLTIAGSLASMMNDVTDGFSSSLHSLSSSVNSTIHV